MLYFNATPPQDLHEASRKSGLRASSSTPKTRRCVKGVEILTWKVLMFLLYDTLPTSSCCSSRPRGSSSPVPTRRASDFVNPVLSSISYLGRLLSRNEICVHESFLATDLCPCMTRATSTLGLQKASKLP